MTLDATFWVTISFFIFLGILIYFKIPQKIKELLEQNILNIKNQVSEAEKLKEDAKNILTEHEKKISNSKNEVKEMINKANEEAEKNVIKVNKGKSTAGTPLGTKILKYLKPCFIKPIIVTAMNINKAIISVTII